jgi:hypothetical protein
MRVPAPRDALQCEVGALVQVSSAVGRAFQLPAGIWYFWAELCELNDNSFPPSPLARLGLSLIVGYSGLPDLGDSD